MNQEKKKNKIVNILINVVFSLIIILTLFISVTALTAKANNGVPQFFGNAPFTVLTDSMTGTINKGDLVIVKLLPKENEKKKDEITKNFVINETIATFKYDINGDGKAEYVTHRLVAMKEIDGNLQVQFQGDKKPDPASGETLGFQQVSYKDVIGVYHGTRLPGFGSVMSFLQSSAGFLIIFVIPLFLYFCFKGYQLFVTAMEFRRENAVATAQLTDEAREEEKKRIREEVLREMQDQKDKE